MLKSAIYEGVVRHRRMTPREHAFEFPLFMVYLDLGEIDRVFSMTRLWSATRAAPARFRRGEYLDRGTEPLETAVRDRVEREIGRRPTGPIRLLTHLRYFGYCFNPVSFYYCFDEGGERVETIVADITNTPWGERHAYVLDRERGMRAGGLTRWEFDKVFHVSPFMPMEIGYDWAFGEPGEELFVHMNLRPREGEGKVFDATLQLKRHELTPRRMRMQLVRFPLMTARVIGRIHFEAFRLWWKGVPAVAHPGAGTGGMASVNGATT